MRGRRPRVPNAHPILLVIVERTHVIRHGLELLVASQADLEVAGVAPSPEEGLQVLARLRRKSRVVVMVSLGSPGPRDAAWLIREIRTSFPAMHILAVGEGKDVASVSRAMFMGADGFIDRGSDPEAFLMGFRRLAEGATVLDGVPRDTLGAVAEGIEAQQDGSPTLSDRQREVLSLAARGLTARQMGARLGVRERTVTTHLQRLYQKLGVSGRVAAINEGNRLGLLSSEERG